MKPKCTHTSMDRAVVGVEGALESHLGRVCDWTRPSPQRAQTGSSLQGKNDINHPLFYTFSPSRLAIEVAFLIH